MIHRLFLKGKKQRSLFQTMLIPLSCIMILQSILFYVAVTYGGIQASLDQSTKDILEQQLFYQTDRMETELHNRWIDFGYTTELLQRAYANYEEQYGTKPFCKENPNSPTLSSDFLIDATPTLLQTLRNNSVNGIFLILNDQRNNIPLGDVTKEQKMGVSLRDLNVKSNDSQNKDLLIGRSPVALLAQFPIALDSWWEAHYSFDRNHPQNNGDFYYQPLRAAWANPESSSKDLGYFQQEHSVSDASQEVVSYSIPLISENGYPYAVLGIELTTKYLSEFLPSNTLGNTGKSSFVLAVHDRNTEILHPILTTGGLFKHNFSVGEQLDCSAYEQGRADFFLTGRSGNRLYTTMQEITLYANNSPFESKELVLLAMQDETELFRHSHLMQRSLIITALVSLFVGIFGILFASKLVVRPVVAVANRAKRIDHDLSKEIEPIGIAEIDQLIHAIEHLTKNANREIARTEFFSRMSHDMRTPMNAIISFSSPLLLGDADAETKDDYLAKINESASYLLGLINEVLDMTKIENNKIELLYQTVPYVKLLDLILPMAGELAEKKGIRLHVDIAKHPTLCVKVDLQHLHQIVMNLLSNAVKFTPAQGKVLLKLGHHQDKNETLYLDIMVKDSGIGMSEAYLEKLFLPFEQEKQGEGGTGLGLTISKKLTELMGGTIRCHSVKGMGTEFFISIPVQESDPLPVMENETPLGHDNLAYIEAHKAVLVQKRLLLCEDHPINAKIAAKILGHYDLLIETAVNGKVGVETFVASDAGYYDGILMDIRMPVMDGLEATREIRKSKHPDARTIPIFAMTANAFATDIQQSQEAGMNGHLSKPIEQEKLISTLIDTFLPSENTTD